MQGLIEMKTSMVREDQEDESWFFEKTNKSDDLWQD